ncbi:MAG: hypothetical protein U0350_51510 [Caldilineaceae bacterium]
MSTYEPEQLLQLWKSEQIDSNMAIGHLMQNLVLQQEAMKKMNAVLIRCQQDIDNLLSQAKLQAASASPKKSGTEN